jgi:type IV secretory pathway VirB2 component (pilin)
MDTLGGGLNAVGGALWAALSTANGQLVAIGLVLLAVCIVAWRRSNRDEATPNAEQVEQIRHFVTGHFARYVARGLAAEGVDPASASVASDRAWQKVFIQHLRLNSELYAYRTDVALAVYRQSIDDAVRAELARLRAAEAPAAT